jgi:hypothetical protein
VFLAGNGSTVSVYNAHALRETGAIPYPGLPRSAVFAPDGSKAYVSTGPIFATNPATRRIEQQLPSRDAQVLRVSADGKRQFAANLDRGAWVYDLTTTA